jgi:hypothetical protein
VVVQLGLAINSRWKNVFLGHTGKAVHLRSPAKCRVNPTLHVHWVDALLPAGLSLPDGHAVQAAVAAVAALWELVAASFLKVPLGQRLIWPSLALIPMTKHVNMAMGA